MDLISSTDRMSTGPCHETESFINQNHKLGSLGGCWMGTGALSGSESTKATEKPRIPLSPGITI